MQYMDPQQPVPPEIQAQMPLPEGYDPHAYHSSEEIAHQNLEEAETLRRKREKAGKLSAVMMTVLIHAIALLVLALWVLPAMKMDVPEITATALPPTDSAIDTPRVNQQTLKPKPSSPSSSAKLLTSVSPTAQVFVPNTPVETTTVDIGLGTGLGMGFGGTGLGDGQGGLDGIPSSMKGRCTLQERMKRLREGGGTQECEEAVVRSLRWLQQKQNSDGSWGTQFKEAMTGLALLAYLGHCETPKSKEYGETVTRGMTYLIDQGSGNNGRMASTGGHHWVYQHSIATYALCEALTFCKELKFDFPGLQETCDQAVNLIVEGQHPNGFWDYGYKKDNRGGDLSVTGWHLQALKAAYHADVHKDRVKKAAEKSLERVKAVQHDSGTFGYTGPQNLGQRLVGVGVLCLQMWGEENSREARAGLRWMRKNMDPVYTAKNSNLYAWYYTTLALFQRGSSYWSKWNRKWRDEMLANQLPDGSWKPEGAVAGGGGGAITTNGAKADADIYRVCLNTLSLEAYYRFLPGTGDL